MFSFLQNARIGIRISLSLVLPIVGLLVFPGFVVFEKRSTVSEITSLQELAELGPVISALVHELQEERGLSAVHIGSKGKKFAAELPQQRKLTDGKNAPMDGALKNFGADSYGTGLINKIKNATSALAEMDRFLARIKTACT